MTKKVDIVVPVFNEAENIQTLYNNLKKYVQSDWRLIIIYDSENDTTLPVAREILKTDNRVKPFENSSSGVLQAILEGFKHAEADAVLEVMVDDPVEVIQKIDTITQAFYEENADIVVASRYMKGGSHKGGPVIKGLLSRLAGLSLYYIIGLPTHDATYNTKLYRKSLLDSINFESKRGFEIALEITIKAYIDGKKIVEVPVEWTEREVGESKFKVFSLLPGYLRWYFFGIKNYFFSRKKSSKV
jgi:dolichol-phosphate mannosyltransferase